LDSDNEWVTFASEEEWQEGLKNFKKENGFKITVTSKSQERHHGHHHHGFKRNEEDSKEKHGCQRFQKKTEEESKGCPRFQKKTEEESRGCPRRGNFNPFRGLQGQFPNFLQGLNVENVPGMINQFLGGLGGNLNFEELIKNFVPKQTGKDHKGFVCDGCNTTPIVGSRWNCNNCKDFDFCDPCFQTKKVNHDAKHTFTKAESKPLDFGVWVDFLGEIQKEAEKYYQPKEKKEEVKEEKKEEVKKEVEEVEVEEISLYEEIDPIQPVFSEEKKEEKKEVVKEEEIKKPSQFENQLLLLQSMGFDDDQSNEVLLKKWNGNVQRVVGELLNQ